MVKILAIGGLAQATGVKVPTIRYYESIGLLPTPLRTQGNRRHYDGSSVQRLKFIKHARELGFEIEAIRALLMLQEAPDQSCAAADVIARARLSEVDRRLASLTALKIELERMIKGCSQNRVEDCRVIEVLADHGECAHEVH